MAYIGNDVRSNEDYKIIDDISSGFNGSTTSFALQVGGATPVPFPKFEQQLLISVNGVIQEPDPTGSAGFKLLGTNIVFSSAPTNGHAFFGVIYAGADYVNAGGTFPDGSINFPSITFSEDTNTGFTRTASGTISVISDGTKVAQFPTSQGSNGQVLVTDGGGTLSYSSTITSPIVSGDLTIPDKIVHTGDTNTAIRFPAADAVSVETGGSEAIRVDSSQRLLVGTDSARTPGAIAPILQVEGTSSNTTSVSITRNSANNDGGRFIFNKSRGASNGSDVVVQDGDTLGQIVFCANDGTDSDSIAASISSTINGTPGSNDVPGKLVFSTTADGAASPTARLTLDSSGNVGIGITSPARKVHLHESTSGNNFISFTNSTTGSTSGDGILVGMDSDESLLITNKENNHIAFATNNTERMRLDSSGRLLIGKSSTSLNNKLQVQAASDATAIAIFGRSADDIGELDFYENDGTTKLGEVQYRTNELNIRHRSEGAEINFATTPSGGSLTDQLTITANGQVGIGTTAPAVNNKLHLRLTNASLASSSTASTLLVENNGNTWITIGSNASYYGGILFADSASSDTGQLRYLHSDNRMEFIVNNTERMRIDSSGRLLVNGTDANAVHSNADDVIIGNTSASLMGLSIVTSTSGYATLQFSDGGGNKNQGQVAYNHSNNSMLFTTNESVAMTIDSSGRLGIGTTSPATDIHTVSSSDHIITHQSTTVGADIRMNFRDSGNTDKGGIHYLFNGNSLKFITAEAERVRIDSSGRLGIGTTSPGASLDIGGNTDDNIQAIFTRGSDTNFQLQFRNESSSNNIGEPQGKFGLFHGSNDIVGLQFARGSSTGAGALLFTTGGTERVRLTSAGRLGIGTAIPGALLHVDSDSATAGIKISGDGNSFLELDADTSVAGTQISFIDFKLAGTVEANIAVNESVSGNPLELNSATNHNIAMVTGGGKVGVGTTLPAGKVHANSAANTATFIAEGEVDNPSYPAYGFSGQNADNGSRGAGMYLPGDNELGFATAGAQRLKIDGNGKFDLGASGPGARLDPSSAGELYIDADPGSNYGSSNIRFRIDGLEMARITAGTHKNFLIGRTTTQASERLSVQNGSNQDVIFATQSQTAQNTRNVVLLNSYSQTDFANQILFMDHQGVGRGSIKNNTSSTQYNTSSDYRLKENEVEISDGIDRLKQLKPYRFNWKNRPNTTVDGFFAHEVQDLVEDCVSGTKDGVDSNGDPEYQEMDHSKLVPLLTAALKEEIGKREALETRIAALEAA